MTPYGMPPARTFCPATQRGLAQHAPAGTISIWNVTNEDGSRFEIQICKECGQLYATPTQAAPRPTLGQRLLKFLSPPVKR